MSSSIEIKIFNVYQCLLDMFGRQAWWPADSPFEIMVGAILTQNTNWSNVEKALSLLKGKITLTPENILSLSQDELEVCLKPSGYFRVKTQRLQSFCHWYLLQGGYNGLQEINTLELRALLLSVHGVGPETADDILLYAFNRPIFVIDAYTRRLLQQLQIIKGNENYDVLRSLFETNLPRRVDLYKQFHALIVLHAKRHCRKNKLDCEICSVD